MSPTLVGLHYKMHVYACLCVAIYRKLKLNGYEGTFAHKLKLECTSEPGVKTTQSNARMATVDHDRKGQAAHTRYRQITYSS